MDNDDIKFFINMLLIIIAGYVIPPIRGISILIILFFMPIIIGNLLSFSLFYLAPNLHQYSFPNQLYIISIMVMLSAVLATSIYAWIMMVLYFHLNTMGHMPTNWGKYRFEMINEVWLRTMIPWPFQKHCYNDNNFVCLAANELSWGNAALFFGIVPGTFAGIATAKKTWSILHK